ncbi:hypothetical protein GM609_06825 [Bombella sp. ESL0387]|nr:hypothetical protein [Bombella sp. ESL0387]
MNAIYATAATQSLAAISNFISDFCSAPKTEANKRAQAFLKGMDDEARGRFLALTQAVRNVISVHETLTMTAAYLNDRNDEQIGEGLPFALAETLTALISGYNNGEALSGVEGNSWKGGLALLRKISPALTSDLDIEGNSELKKVFFDCLEGKIELKKAK